MIICVSFGASFSLGKIWPGSWAVIFPSLYAISYGIGHRQFRGITTNWQQPLSAIGAIGILVLAFQFTFRHVWQYMLHSYNYNLSRDIFDLSLLPDHFISLMMIGTAIMLFYDSLKLKNLTNSLFMAFPLLAMAGYLFRIKAMFLILLLFNAYLFILSLDRIMTGIRKNSLTAVNGGMLILAILIIIRFFDSDINFIIKGLSFIMVGIGFLTVNFALTRRGGAR